MIMKKDAVLAYLGYGLVLLGFFCLVIYYLGVHVNFLLFFALLLELAGIITLIFLNPKHYYKGNDSENEE